MSTLPKLRADVVAEAVTDAERGAFYVLKSADGSRSHELSQTAYMALSMMKGEASFESWMASVQAVYPMVLQTHLENLLNDMKSNDFLDDPADAGLSLDLEEPPAPPPALSTPRPEVTGVTTMPLEDPSADLELPSEPPAPPALDMEAPAGGPSMPEPGKMDQASAAFFDSLDVEFTDPASPSMLTTVDANLAVGGDGLTLQVSGEDADSLDSEPPAPPDLDAAFDEFSPTTDAGEQPAGFAEPPNTGSTTTSTPTGEPEEAPPSFAAPATGGFRLPNQPKEAPPSFAAPATGGFPLGEVLDAQSDAVHSGEGEPADGDLPEPPPASEVPQVETSANMPHDTSGFDLGEVLDAQAEAAHASASVDDNVDAGPPPDGSHDAPIALPGSGGMKAAPGPSTSNPADAAATEPPAASDDAVLPEVPPAPTAVAADAPAAAAEEAAAGFAAPGLTNHDFYNQDGSNSDDAPAVEEPPAVPPPAAAPPSSSPVAKVALFAAALVAVAAGGGMLVQREVITDVKLELTAAGGADVKATHPGVVASVDIEDGQAVDKGAQLVTFEAPPDDADAQAEALQADVDFYKDLTDGKEGKRLRVAVYRAKLKVKKALKSAKTKHRVVEKTKAKLDEKKAKLAKKVASATAKLEAADSDKKKKIRQKTVDKLNKKMGKLDDKIAKSEAKLVKYSGQQVELQAKIDRLSGDLSAAQKKAEDALAAHQALVAGGAVAPLTAPSSGTVHGLSAKAGQKVQAGDVLLQLREPGRFTAPSSAFATPPSAGEKLSCGGQDIVVDSVHGEQVELSGGVKAGANTCKRKGASKPYTLWLVDQLKGG